MRALLCFVLLAAAAPAQRTVIVRPAQIDDVLVNPGIGFMTFQRANGDGAGGGGRSKAVPGKDYPQTSMDYLRVYWNFFEPEEGKYRWDVIESSLAAAAGRGQTLMFRIMPYGSNASDDVPRWYRAMVGEEPDRREPNKVRTNPEDPRYVRYFGRMVREIARRYDGHPALESVDLSIIGAWGEGAGSEQMSQPVREALVDLYLESFVKTPLVMLLTDEKTNKYGISKRAVGWRVDCLGDMGGFRPTWSHMHDYYPQGVLNFGMRDAWQKAPVSFEACWVMGTWKEKGWDVDYIIDQSLKWHISSFNGKSSAVPAQWGPQVDRWLKRMGYRFALRKFTYPERVAPGGQLAYQSWWENQGVAPCYRRFPLALRLKGQGRAEVLPADADIRDWLPGDIVHDGAVFVPRGMPAGEYDLEIAILDESAAQPKVRLAIAGRGADGWYGLGKIRLE